MRGALVLLIVSGGLLGRSAVAQEGSPLRGPDVESEPARAPSLVEREFDGSLVRLSEPPEMAALELLDLDGATREAVGAVLRERSALIDGIVARNVGAIGRAIQVFQSGAEGRARVEAFREVYALLAPLRERASLREEIAAALPMAEAQLFGALVSDYESAADAERREGGERAGRIGRAPASRGEEARRLFEELRASIGRVLVDPASDLQALIARLDVDDETKGVIQAVVQERLGAMEPGEDYRKIGRGVVPEVLRRLEPAQRDALLGELVRVRQEG